MTIPELQAKRDEILGRAGEAKVTFGDKSVEYSEASKALVMIDAEIARLTAAASSTGRFATSFVTFTK